MLLQIQLIIPVKELIMVRFLTKNNSMKTMKEEYEKNESLWRGPRLEYYNNEDYNNEDKEYSRVDNFSQKIGLYLYKEAILDFMIDEEAYFFFQMKVPDKYKKDPSLIPFFTKKSLSPFSPLYLPVMGRLKKNSKTYGGEIVDSNIRMLDMDGKLIKKDIKFDIACNNLYYFNNSSKKREILLREFPEDSVINTKISSLPRITDYNDKNFGIPRVLAFCDKDVINNFRILNRSEPSLVSLSLAIIGE